MNPKTFKSPLEDKSEILERVGLFTVLFNAIDHRLGLEFYFIIDQSNARERPVLGFLSSQDFKKRLDILKLILGDALYSKIDEINKFRTFISHSLYGVSSAGKISMTKLKRNSGEYDTVDLDKVKLDEYIQKEREVLASFHELVLERKTK